MISIIDDIEYEKAWIRVYHIAILVVGFAIDYYLNHYEVNINIIYNSFMVITALYIKIVYTLTRYCYILNLDRISKELWEALMEHKNVHIPESDIPLSVRKELYEIIICKLRKKSSKFKKDFTLSVSGNYACLELI